MASAPWNIRSIGSRSLHVHQMLGCIWNSAAEDRTLKMACPTRRRAPGSRSLLLHLPTILHHETHLGILGVGCTAVYRE